LRILNSRQEISMNELNKVMASKTQGKHRFNATISDNWSINGVPNGGYLMAVAAAPILNQRQENTTPIITANFLTRCSQGDAMVQVVNLASSKQFDRYRIGVYQNGIQRICALGTLVNSENQNGFTYYESAPPDLAPLDQCLPMENPPGCTFFDGVDLRLDPATAGWTMGRLASTSELRGWIRFFDSRMIDYPSLLIIADAFPPPVFASQGKVAWVPTIELSINIRQLPSPGWLKGIFRTRFITGGLLEEDGQIWDEAGNLILISRQIAQYRRHDG
jgi:hypothetical protein